MIIIPPPVYTGLSRRRSAPRHVSDDLLKKAENNTRLAQSLVAGYVIGVAAVCLVIVVMAIVLWMIGGTQ